MRSGRLLRSLTAAVVFGAGLAVATPAAAAPTVARTVFSDGFGGDRGAAPDAAKWAPPGRAWLDGAGLLALDDPMRTAATITQRSGHAEARIKLRRTSGAWRALGVLDESGRIPAGAVETFADDGVDDDDFHTYAIDWTPASMVWSVDGAPVLRFTPAASGKPFFLTLNLTGGGYRSPTMVVDYVRVTVRVAVRTTPWKKFTDYRAGQYVTYQGRTYRVRERHTALPGWQPSRVPALFQKI